MCHLLPSLLLALSNTQSPKLHKRVLLVLNFLVQRASQEHLSALTPHQLGALLGGMRALLASPSTLEQLCALRMLSTALAEWSAIGSTALRLAALRSA